MALTRRITTAIKSVAGFSSLLLRQTEMSAKHQRVRSKGWARFAFLIRLAIE
jgi:hypothetical protein